MSRHERYDALAVAEKRAEADNFLRESLQLLYDDLRPAGASRGSKADMCARAQAPLRFGGPISQLIHCVQAIDPRELESLGNGGGQCEPLQRVEVQPFRSQ